MKIAPDEIRGKRPDPVFASCRDAVNLSFRARPASSDCPRDTVDYEAAVLSPVVVEGEFIGRQGWPLDESCDRGKPQRLLKRLRPVPSPCHVDRRPLRPNAGKKDLAFRS